MATKYTEFDCLGTDLLTTIQTAILGSSDWTRPNAAGFPHLYKATTTRGAQMVIDLNAAAPSVSALTMDIFHSHNGTVGVSAARRYLRIKGGTTGTLATNTYHGIVSAGKEHFFLNVEGPRSNEANPDNAIYGSVRNYVFLDDLVPYFPAVDTTPTVVHNAAIINIGNNTPTLGSNPGVAYAARNGGNTVYHSAGRIGSMGNIDIATNNIEITNLKNTAALDSNRFMLWPYVFCDSLEGPRGRLASFFYGGPNVLTGTTDTAAALPPVGQVVDWSGRLFKLVTVSKGDGNNFSASGAFGSASQQGVSIWSYSPIVAVPYAA